MKCAATQSLLRLAICLLAVAAPASAANRCLAGNAKLEFPLENGYTLHIAAGTGEHANTCHGSIDGGPSGAIFNVYSYEFTADEFSGKDVNNDGQADLILVGRIAKGDPLTYWIISFVEPAGVARQITTVTPLSFEDRDGDGKIEIWTREWSYDGFDGLPSEDSPHPLVALRLVGNRLIYVSHLFPAEYEREIIQSKQRITQDGINKLKNLSDASAANIGVAGGGAGVGGEGKPDPKMDARAYEAKLGILEVATAYMYSGRTAEAMKALGDWPYADRDRVRTMLVRQRANGIMKQLNAPQPLAPKQAATRSAPSSSPQ
jgi:hypothetical protein